MTETQIMHLLYCLEEIVKALKEMKPGKPSEG